MSVPDLGLSDGRTGRYRPAGEDEQLLERPAACPPAGQGGVRAMTGLGHMSVPDLGHSDGRTGRYQPAEEDEPLLERPAACPPAGQGGVRAMTGLGHMSVPGLGLPDGRTGRYQPAEEDAPLRCPSSMAARHVHPSHHGETSDAALRPWVRSDYSHPLARDASKSPLGA